MSPERKQEGIRVAQSEEIRFKEFRERFATEDAMGQRDAQYLLNGIVEMDDGYVGGPCHGGKRGRGTEKHRW